MKRVVKTIVRIGLKLFGVVLLLIIVLNAWIVISTSSQVYDNIDDLPSKKVGLVLGTSHKLLNGDSNQFFHQRIDLAVQLYKAGKVKHLIVSGDNATKYYNEPLNMRNALIAKGVPSEAISRDFAGFRTLDSIVRCKLIFDQEDITVITQTFHSYRALFIGNHHNMKMSAFVSEDLPFLTSMYVEVRELLARTVAVWDLFIVDKMPKFLGEKEPIHIQD